MISDLILDIQTRYYQNMLSRSYELRQVFFEFCRRHNSSITNRAHRTRVNLPLWRQINVNYMAVVPAQPSGVSRCVILWLRAIASSTAELSCRFCVFMYETANSGLEGTQLVRNVPIAWSVQRRLVGFVSRWTPRPTCQASHFALVCGLKTGLYIGCEYRCLLPLIAQSVSRTSTKTPSVPPTA